MDTLSSEISLSQKFEIERQTRMVEDCNKEELKKLYLESLNILVQKENYLIQLMKKYIMQPLQLYNKPEPIKKLFEYPKTPNFLTFCENIEHIVNNGGDKDYVLSDIVDFVATVKLHGTNCAFVVNSDGTYYSQSRNQVLEDDSHFGFKSWVDSNITKLKKCVVDYTNTECSCCTNSINIFNPVETVVVYGEWCGKGINKKLGITKLDKRIFVVFAVKVILKDGSEYIDYDNLADFTYHSVNLYNCYDFPTYYIKLNITELKEPCIIDYLNKILDNVVKKCPASNYFGIDGTGEGIVLHPEYIYNNKFLFKYKPEKTKSEKVHNIPEGINHNIELSEELCSVFLLHPLGGKPPLFNDVIDKLREQGHSMKHTMDIKFLVKGLTEQFNNGFIDYLKTFKDIDLKTAYKDFISLAKKHYMEMIKS